MDKVSWRRHFKYYDLFQMNRDAYLATLKFHLNQLRGLPVVLDSGAGSGNLTFELLKDGHKVFSIDSNEFALKVLKEKCKNNKKNLIVKLSNVKDTPFKENSFDGVVSMFVIPFSGENSKYFSEVYRILKKNGIFSLSAWSPVKDTFHGIIETQIEELKRKRILPKYKKELDYQMKSAKQAVNIVIKGDNLSKLVELMKSAGFKKIKIFINNPYKKYAYFITAIK